MSVTAERGAIYSEEAYARAKMLDHSAWQSGEKVVRLITPSDIDVCFDNNGKILFCEFSSDHARWDKLKVGQKWLYESCVRTGTHCAALCKHSVPLEPKRPIDTRYDVDSFALMFFAHGIRCLPPVNGKNGAWDRFVLAWLATPTGPEEALQLCLSKAFGR